jgi:ribosomal protein S1
MDQRRVSLSLNALGADPWTDIESRFSVGQDVEGVVQSVRDFGVFISIGEGITALLPGSESGLAHGQPLQSKFKMGSTVQAKVLRIDRAERKMALTTKEGRTQEQRGEGRRRTKGGSGPRVWMDRDEVGSEPVGSLGAALMAALGKKDDEE